MTTRGWLLLLVSCSVGSFFFGRSVQSLGTDRYYSLCAMGTTESVHGSIKLTQAMDHVGTKFMESEFSTLSIGKQAGEIVVYKAQLVFQENYPSVDELEFDERTIKWKDGRFRYDLQLIPLAKESTDMTEGSSDNASKQIEPRRTLRITDRF